MHKILCGGVVNQMLTQKALLHHAFQQLNIPACKSFTKRFTKILCDMSGNINTHFINQGGSSNRETKIGGKGIHCLGICAFLRGTESASVLDWYEKGEGLENGKRPEVTVLCVENLSLSVEDPA